jgi:ATP-dependent RNA helicase MRH4, mitochondrial
LLADIAAARGHPIPSSETTPSTATAASSSQVFDYPFNLLLTTATIPSSLATYLDTHHPKLTRLASPNLHKLPSKLRTEYVSWTSGNRYADIERRIRRVWADEAPSGNPRSKILIFCNRSSKVTDLGQYLEEKGLPNVALTSDGEARQFGSNKHLAGFLKNGAAVAKAQPTSGQSLNPNEDKEPHVMITTSLLSRGLDFSQDLKHVFIVDEPRNMIDFLHRAGRSGRAGQSGKVVIFGKMSGRGSEKAREARNRVAGLSA